MWLKLETGMLLMLLLFSVLWKRKQDFSIGKLFGISSLWNSPRLSFFSWPIRSLAPYSSQMQTFMHTNMHRQAHSHDHTTFIELWASAAERESGHFNQPNNPLQYFNLLPPFNASCPPPPTKPINTDPIKTTPYPCLYHCDNPTTISSMSWQQLSLFSNPSYTNTHAKQPFTIKIASLSKCPRPPAWTVSLNCFRWRALTETAWTL